MDIRKLVKCIEKRAQAYGMLGARYGNGGRYVPVTASGSAKELYSGLSSALGGMVGGITGGVVGAYEAPRGDRARYALEGAKSGATAGAKRMRNEDPRQLGVRGAAAVNGMASVPVNSIDKLL